MALKRKPTPKLLIVVSALTLGGAAHAQDNVRFEAENFGAQVLAYTPVQRDGVSDDDFAEGEFFLEQVKSAVSHDPENFLAPHYWNVAVAFANLGEPREHIALAFETAIATEPDAICGYLNHFGGGGAFESLIPNVVLPFQATCSEELSEDEAFDVERYIAEHGFDGDLVREMAAILEDDQRFRKPIDERQAPLDAANQQRIDALFAEYGGYIGTSLVGEELDYVMFLVIQHSNPDYMERYLPHVQAAVLNGELAATPLKMLLDRIYWLREGYQLFGSQPGVPIADDATRRVVIERYQVPEGR